MKLRLFGVLPFATVDVDPTDSDWNVFYDHAAQTPGVIQGRSEGFSCRFAQIFPPPLIKPSFEENHENNY